MTIAMRQLATTAAFWSVVESTTRLGGSFVVFVCLARLLEAKEFGAVALANVFLGLIGAVTIASAQGVLIQRFDIVDADYDAGFWLAISAAVACAGPLVLSAYLLAEVFDAAEMEVIVAALTPVLLLNSLAVVPQAWFARLLNFRVPALAAVAGVLLGGAFGVALAYRGWGAWSLVGQQLASSSVSTCALWGCCPWRPRLRLSLRVAREHLNFAKYLAAAALTNFAMSRCDTLIIGLSLGPAATGAYTVGQRVPALLTEAISGALSRVAVSGFARLQHDCDQLRDAFRAAVRMTATVAFPTFLGLACVTPEVVLLVLGTKWLDAVPVVRLLSIFGALSAVGYFNFNLMVAMGRPKWQLFLTALSACLNVILFLTVVRLGITAVAAAFVIRAYLVFPLSIFCVSRLLRIEVFEYLSNFVEPLNATFLMVASVLVVRYTIVSSMSPLVVLIASAAVGAATYVLALRAFYPDLLREMWLSARTILARLVAVT